MHGDLLEFLHILGYSPVLAGACSARDAPRPIARAENYLMDYNFFQARAGPYW